MRLFLFYLLFLLFPAAIFLGSNPVSVLAGEKDLTKTTTPIQIEADHMESRRLRNSVTFSGNVVAKQEELTIHADQMTVDYKANPATNPASNMTQGDMTQKVQKILAKGNVKLIKENWVSTGETMEFYPDSRKVVMKGNARVWQDKNMVSGETITLHLDEGKSVVEGGTDKKQRVKAYIYPSENQNNKK